MPTLSAAWNAKVKFLLWGQKEDLNEAFKIESKVCQSALISACLVLAAELLVGDVCGQVGVQQGTEGQPIVPAAAEVGDVDVLKGAAVSEL